MTGGQYADLVLDRIVGLLDSRSVARSDVTDRCLSVILSGQDGSPCTLYLGVEEGFPMLTVMYPTDVRVEPVGLKSVLLRANKVNSRLKVGFFGVSPDSDRIYYKIDSIVDLQHLETWLFSFMSTAVRTVEENLCEIVRNIQVRP